MSKQETTQPNDPLINYIIPNVRVVLETANIKYGAVCSATTVATCISAVAGQTEAMFIDLTFLSSYISKIITFSNFNTLMDSTV